MELGQHDPGVDAKSQPRCGLPEIVSLSADLSFFSPESLLERDDFDQ